MKKHLFILLAVCLMLPVWASAEEIATEYNVTTKDYEATELGQVSVEQTIIEKNSASWTLDEIDYWIAAYEESVKQYQKFASDMRELRANIETEAKKVKLSVGEQAL